MFHSIPTRRSEKKTRTSEKNVVEINLCHFFSSWAFIPLTDTIYRICWWCFSYLFRCCFFSILSSPLNILNVCTFTIDCQKMFCFKRPYCELVYYFFIFLFLALPLAFHKKWWNLSTWINACATMCVCFWRGWRKSKMKLFSTLMDRFLNKRHPSL